MLVTQESSRNFPSFLIKPFVTYTLLSANMQEKSKCDADQWQLPLNPQGGLKPQWATGVVWHGAKVVSFFSPHLDQSLDVGHHGTGVTSGKVALCSWEGRAADHTPSLGDMGSAVQLATWADMGLEGLAGPGHVEGRAEMTGTEARWWLRGRLTGKLSLELDPGQLKPEQRWGAGACELGNLPPKGRLMGWKVNQPPREQLHSRSSPVYKALCVLRPPQHRELPPAPLTSTWGRRSQGGRDTR